MLRCTCIACVVVACRHEMGTLTKEEGDTQTTETDMQTSSQISQT